MRSSSYKKTECDAEGHTAVSDGEEGRPMVKHLNMKVGFSAELSLHL